MTYRNRQRRRAAQARASYQTERKWPETAAALNALSATNSPSAQTPSLTAPDSATVRTQLAQNAQRALQTLQAQQAQRVQQARQTQQACQNLLNSPYLSMTGQGVTLQNTRVNSSQLGFTGASAPYADPAPEPGPPPQPEPGQTNPTPRYAFSDPGIAAALQAQEKHDKQVQDQLATTAFVSVFGPTAQTQSGKSDKPVLGAAADYGLLLAEQFEANKNQYGINIDALLKTAESQLNTKEGYDTDKNGSIVWNNDNPYSKDNPYKPKAGDFIFLQWNETIDGKTVRKGHTGIVVFYDDKTQTIYTIEGNTGNNYNKVLYKTRSLKDSNISGYGINGSESFGKKPDISKNSE